MRQASGTLLDILEAVSTLQDQGYTFLQEDGSEMHFSFQALVATAQHRAGDLQALGMQKGERLALVLPHPKDFVISFLGAVMAGIQPVPLYPPHSLGKLNVY